jgi:hypothetical protein
MQKRFAHLLDGFSTVTVRRGTSIALPTGRIRTFLDQFREHRERGAAKEQKQAANDRDQLAALLDAYNETQERYRQQQEQLADDFNLLGVMQLIGKEVRHSMVLAWLLDHDMWNLGTHAQGSLGFRLFVAEFGLPIEYADCKYRVRREVVGDASIVDIEVACRGRFLIHIENKIWSCEGIDQTDREWSDLQRRAEDLTVSMRDVHAFFLTPHGKSPTNPSFRPIPWRRIVRVLEKFAAQAKPPDVRLFARHYARALNRFIVGPQDRNEDTNAE